MLGNSKRLAKKRIPKGPVKSTGEDPAAVLADLAVLAGVGQVRLSRPSRRRMPR